MYALSIGHQSFSYAKRGVIHVYRWSPAASEWRPIFSIRVLTAVLSAFAIQGGFVLFCSVLFAW